MKTFKKQFNIKTKLETLDHYVRSILNKFDPGDSKKLLKLNSASMDCSIYLQTYNFGLNSV